ncbi:serine/threonine-protein kinase [Thermocatellispora tengchongensis]|uniref:non-specific serine/threonine protein kinase n=1 Tax=Thermocatellispora tengchongensis TaxID=1073253 RepID=A0A840P2E2_9ACTN|nr:Stk1 family PASTA domain-containing Ser/Thr kinase [Thermocatellispora tengchongensis]MBB5131630.1 serine/threonine-protein kinase [Thermocatellispora tengchongensis]
MDTTLADPLVGRLVDGRYRVESRIARGGMATVYVALDIRLDRTVALKVMHRSLAEDPAFVRRFIGEAKSVASLSHPNVVQVFDQGTDADIVYLSMEYVPGRTLRDVLRERGRLRPRESLEIMIPVLAALGAAHQQGMIHRDVKPENVLLSDDGRVKVVDFGLARAVEASNQTRTGVMIGTIGYMAPEQVTKGAADVRSDVYAAGVMLYELLVGRPPYEGESPMAIAYKHVHETVPPPSSLVPGTPPQLDTLVAAATAREPEARPADATAMLVAAVEAHRTLPQDTTPPVSPTAATSLYDSGPMAAGAPGSLPPPAGSPASVPPPPGHASAAPPVAGPSHTLIQPRTEMMTGPAEPGGRGRRSRSGGERRGPRPSWFLVGLAAFMAVAVGLTGWYFSQERAIAVPELLGKNLTVAKTEAEGRGFVVVIGEGVNDDKVPEGNVLRTDPAGGSEVEPGSRLVLIPSLGPKLVTVPNVQGLSEGDAKARLAEAGLVPDDVTRIANETVQRGLVLRSSPQVGAKVKEGSKVDIVLSAGLLTPDVMGLPRDQAEQFLREQGFNVQVIEQADDAQPCTVIAQEPKAKSEIDKGALVSLTVSQCQQEWHWPWENNDENANDDTTFNVIPNVLYKNVRDAQQELRAAGFRVKTRKFYGRGSERVRGQRPIGGEAPVGTEVTIWH